MFLCYMFLDFNASLVVIRVRLFKSWLVYTSTVVKLNILRSAKMHNFYNLLRKFLNYYIITGSLGAHGTKLFGL